METVLHIFKDSAHARAILEGTPVPMACGEAFHIETVDGKPVLPAGGGLCLECMDAEGPEIVAKMLKRRQSKKLRAAKA